MNVQANNEYYIWLCNKAMDRPYFSIKHKKLLTVLYNTPFEYSLDFDKNRYFDGLDLRDRFEIESGLALDLYSDMPCSMLEMMLALANRMEVSLLSDIELGDRTSVWFTNMLRSLGLYSYTDSNFDLESVYSILDNFMNRDYSPDGQGGLFSLSNPPCDLRKVEIWAQMCWYVNELE